MQIWNARVSAPLAKVRKSTSCTGNSGIFSGGYWMIAVVFPGDENSGFWWLGTCPSPLKLFGLLCFQVETENLRDAKNEYVQKMRVSAVLADEGQAWKCLPADVHFDWVIALNSVHDQSVPLNRPSVGFTERTKHLSGGNPFLNRLHGGYLLVFSHIRSPCSSGSCPIVFPCALLPPQAYCRHAAQ